MILVNMAAKKQTIYYLQHDILGVVLKLGYSVSCNLKCGIRDLVRKLVAICAESVNDKERLVRQACKAGSLLTAFCLFSCRRMINSIKS